MGRNYENGWGNTLGRVRMGNRPRFYFDFLILCPSHVPFRKGITVEQILPHVLWIERRYLYGGAELYITNEEACSSGKVLARKQAFGLIDPRMAG